LGNISIGNGKKYKDQLTAKEWQDLIDFEGNANGFTVLTGSRNRGRSSDLFATLGAFMKYQRKVYRRNQQPISQIKVWLFKLIRYSLKK
jgi:hypothetical protein